MAGRLGSINACPFPRREVPIPLIDPVEARVLLLENNVTFSYEFGNSMELICSALGTAAKEIKRVVESAPQHDKGRLIAALDALQQARNNARDSLLLPQVQKEKRPREDSNL